MTQSGAIKMHHDCFTATAVYTAERCVTALEEISIFYLVSYLQTAGYDNTTFCYCSVVVTHKLLQHLNNEQFI